jgi:hypothetical protein
MVERRTRIDAILVFLTVKRSKSDGDVVVGKMIFSYYDDVDVGEMALREERSLCPYPRVKGDEFLCLLFS